MSYEDSDTARKFLIENGFIAVVSEIEKPGRDQNLRQALNTKLDSSDNIYSFLRELQKLEGHVGNDRVRGKLEQAMVELKDRARLPPISQDIIRNRRRNRYRRAAAALSNEAGSNQTNGGARSISGENKIGCKKKRRKISKKKKRKTTKKKIRKTKKKKTKKRTRKISKNKSK